MAAGRRTATIVLTSSHAALSLIAGLLFSFCAAPLARAERCHRPHLRYRDAHRRRPAGGRRGCTGAHLLAADPPARVRDTAAGAHIACRILHRPFPGRCADRRDSDRRDLAGPRPLRYLGVRGYGAAAAIGILAFAAYHLAFVAERPAPERKPRPAKKKLTRATTENADDSDVDKAIASEPEAREPADEPSGDSPDSDEKVLEPARGLRNRRTRRP